MKHRPPYVIGMVDEKVNTRLARLAERPMNRTMVPAALLPILLAMFVIIALAEVRWTARAGQDGSDRRLAINFSLGLVNLAIGSLSPISAVATAIVAERHGWGVFNLRALPALAAVPIAYVTHSFVNYWLHRVSHRLGWLWRLHRLHHGDAALDLSSALRNHPVEVAIGLLVAGATALFLGASPTAIAIADTILFAQNLAAHGNIRLPAGLARRLEWVIVTPSAHCVHHSDERRLTDSNYSESLSWWDRLFGTWRGTQPVARIGLDTQPR
jgi:sterol desaturase/sphingolipid hydroxylase (fatty acid hydroxylase superfamily)